MSTGSRPATCSCYEPTVGASRIISPNGCRYVYMTQWDSEAARDLVLGRPD